MDGSNTLFLLQQSRSTTVEILLLLLILLVVFCTRTSASQPTISSKSTSSPEPIAASPKVYKQTMRVSNIDNPTPHVIPEGVNATPLEVVGATASDKLVIILVGLPGTGKTHMAKRICRYISFFLDIPTEIFNVGEYRSKLCGNKLPASFFDPNNTEALEKRAKVCEAAVDDLVEFMRKDGVRLAVYDSTNSSPERRTQIVKKLVDTGIGFKKMFVETICDDEAMIEKQFRNDKLRSPDYKDSDTEEAVKDFMQRRKNYEGIYHTLEDSDGCYIKVLNSRKFVIHNVRGYLPLKVVHFIMNLHTLPRTFYLSRHGQSEYNLLGKIGGDSGLSKNGEEYARRLGKFAEDVIGKNMSTDDEGNESEVSVPARLWTSTLRRTKQTAKHIKHDTIDATWDNGDNNKWVQCRPNELRNLDELYAGNCDGMTYKEIETVYPEEFEARQSDKLKYRYPRGESYLDVMLRLEPLAHDMERVRETLLVVAHQGILRILLAYFTGLDRDKAPYVKIPLNHIIKLSTHAYGCNQEVICLMQKDEMLDDGQDEPQEGV